MAALFSSSCSSEPTRWNRPLNNRSSTKVDMERAYGKEIKMGSPKPVILLVENDKADQEIIRRIADQGATSAQLEIVSSGQEALDYLSRSGAYKDSVAPSPNLVLLDLNMPGLSGLDVLARIRGQRNTRSLPVIVLSTSDQESDIVQSYDLGANSFLTKPVKFDEFIRVIRELDEYWFDLAVLPPPVGSVSNG